MGPWARRAGVATVLVALAVGAALAAWVGPYVRDDFVLDGVVRAVALDWRDFGLDKARLRLQFELDQREIGLQVADDDCAFSKLDGGVREVRCAWRVDLDLPLTARTVPLAFQSSARVDAGGDLR